MRNNHIIYLDCDGVLADFVTGILTAMKHPFDGYDLWPWGHTFDIFPQIGSNWAEASKFCDIDFWTNLPWMPDGQEILCQVFARFHRRELMLLTKPMDHDGSYTGKAQWVAKHVPELRRRIVPTHISKSEFAHGFNCLLIDDSQKNVEEFICAGGAGILVPRPYNENDRIYAEGKAVSYVANRMDKWIELVNHPAKNRKGDSICHQ